MVKEIENMEEFEKEVLKSEKPVIVDFWAEWCPPCKILLPIIEELAKEYEGRVKFVKVNIEKANEIAMLFGVQAIPTLIFFEGGSAVEKIVGALPKEELKKIIARVFSVE